MVAICDQLQNGLEYAEKTKAIIPVEAIVKKIIILRGERVILDRDIAEM